MKLPGNQHFRHDTTLKGPKICESYWMYGEQIFGAFALPRLQNLIDHLVYFVGGVKWKHGK
jgi:hypothetical protein